MLWEYDSILFLIIKMLYKKIRCTTTRGFHAFWMKRPINCEVYIWGKDGVDLGAET